jgi:hypothetical protein
MIVFAFGGSSSRNCSSLGPSYARVGRHVAVVHAVDNKSRERKEGERVTEHALSFLSLL